MTKADEDGLYLKLGKLSMFWFADRNIPMTPESYGKNLVMLSKRTNLSIEDLQNLYKFIQDKTREMSLENRSDVGHTEIKGFCRHE
jgi:hypothetical protein